VIVLKPACGQMIELLAGVADTPLSSPSPCADFTVGELIDHVDHVSRLFTALALHDAEGLRDPSTGPIRAHDDTNWCESVGLHMRRLGSAWDDPEAWQGKGNLPGSNLSNETWGKITLTEIVVHGWDIAKATGQPFDLPETTLRTCLNHVANFVPNAPNPALWKHPLCVSSDARLIDRIVAITGRIP
jgi:uncharacterized protein (TIGR03086 family)